MSSEVFTPVREGGEKKVPQSAAKLHRKELKRLVEEEEGVCDRVIIIIIFFYKKNVSFSSQSPRPAGLLHKTDQPAKQQTTQLINLILLQKK